MSQAALRFAQVAFVLLAGLTPAVARAQQTTSTEVRNFEVVSVAGNKVVVKERAGTREYTIPEAFRFEVGGKRVPVSELKPGMKGTATFTTTTTSHPVQVTEVKQAEVLQASAASLLVRGPDGFRMYTPGDIEKRGITIMKDGRPVEFSDLHTGDRLTATIITEGPPKVMTETQVKAVLSHAPAEAVPNLSAAAAAPPASASAAAAPAPAASASATAAPAPAVSASAAAAPAVVPSPATTPPVVATTVTEASNMWLWMLLVGLAVIALVWFVVARRTRSPQR